MDINYWVSVLIFSFLFPNFPSSLEHQNTRANYTSNSFSHSVANPEARRQKPPTTVASHEQVTFRIILCLNMQVSLITIDWP